MFICVRKHKQQQKPKRYLIYHLINGVSQMSLAEYSFTELQSQNNNRLCRKTNNILNNANKYNMATNTSVKDFVAERQLKNQAKHLGVCDSVCVSTHVLFLKLGLHVQFLHAIIVDTGRGL